ncbi:MULTISPECIES: DUF4245 domain-containing protein [Streptomycetaceae]|uniref:Secreted protein n=1 Tax=Streptantibioticus cattleyicolor (strain ATCC 35852 / DSM 46488 / JCM 4925 / NBRC 14057 / NRRL 8057) TaxID=1003195 RepID=F8K2H8_STREN|nr:MULTISPECIES: DUF4245 domain-containing protein [Streptomycetaceae]AEW96273.1 secreted protein [Streptantibioticus cattleyicolor NRRL 8057 = DSM 46488]MYS60790.1 DUF4245 family protein [Streptomyces sp. SID5468]CCB76611.1 Secreted protein [Streptantibioticus cattleyicolor NRRL 8057 = DSM 46488]
MRGKQTVRDMVLSLAAIGVVVAAIYLFVPHSGEDPVKTVSYNVELGQARRAAPYPVAAPDGLGGKWRPTSVHYDAADPRATTWHLGFIDPENEYVAVEQSNGDPDKFIAATTVQSGKDGSQQVSGVTWDRYDGGRYRALVRHGHGVTTLVTGTAPYGQLARMAAALRTS